MLTVRPARREDHAAYSRLFPELEVPDAIPDIDTWWSRQGPTTLIAEAEGRVTGYGFYELIGPTLYVRNVVTSRGARRTGAGRALMHAMLERGRAAGAQRWCLNVKEDNVPAITLYESLGLRVAYATLVLQVPWAALTDVARDGITVRTPLASEDARIESKLKLLEGQIERQRELKRVLYAAFESGAPVGLASFDPGFPGCFPFRARNLNVVAALLSALAPFRKALDTRDWRASAIQLVIEGQEDVAHALEALGAKRIFRILHLAAPLP